MIAQDIMAELPAGWRKLSIKHCLRPGQEGSRIGPFGSALKLEGLVDEGVPVFGQGNVMARDYTFGKRFVTEQRFLELKPYEARPGDVLVTMMGSAGRCDVVPTGAPTGIVDSHLLRLRLNSTLVDARFFCWFLDQSIPANAQFDLMSKGSIMSGLNSDIVRNLWMPTPPLETQTAIADYLDCKTADLDALIEKKRKLLDLLAEERAALINQAVTKGLDPSVPMKDSGIPWIGEVPAHWLVGKVKWFCTVKDGTHDTPAYFDESAETYPLITSVNFVDEAIDFSTAKHISADDHKQICRRSNTSRGDVLMSMIGGNIGKTVIVETDRNFSIKNVGLFKTSGDEILGRLLFYILRSSILQVEIDLSSRGGAQGFLGLQNLRDILFPRIPRKEITEMVGFLDRKVRILTIVTARIQTQIDRLQEYRQALITAAVTGQLNIEAAA